MGIRDCHALSRKPPGDGTVPRLALYLVLRASSYYVEEDMDGGFYPG